MTKQHRNHYPETRFHRLTATHPKYRPDIDGLRAIAVLSVVGFHAFPSVVKGGFIGVDIFFVISGYLISSIVFGNLESGSFSYFDFYVRRIKRIFPALILVLVACATFGWIALPPEEYRSLGKHMASGVAFVSNFALWGESGYFDSSADSKPLLHLWSLAIEEQFYILWPLLLGFLWKKRWNFLAVTVGIAFASFAVNIWVVGADQVAAFYSPISRFWELMVGGILAYVTLHRPHHMPNWPNLFAMSGLTLILIGLMTLSKSSVFPGWPALLPTIGAFLLIAAGPVAWINRCLLGNRLMVAVGLISYPLYLWHWPALFVVSNHQMVAPIQPAALYWAVKLFAILICLMLSYVTFRVVEKPIRKNTSPKVPFALVATLVVSGLGGVLIMLTNGMERRFPDNLNALLSFDYRSVEQYRRGTCFVDVAAGFKDRQRCTSVPPSGSNARLLLWGDSHAAHLYPGLKAVVGNRIGITQLNTGGCPPLLGIAIGRNAQCQSNNELVLRTIEDFKPAIVVLSAGWRRYQDWKDVSKTIQKLRDLKVAEIVLVGPAPQWNGTLPRQIFEYAKSHGFAEIPAKLPGGFDQNISRLDEAMAKFAEEQGVRYISPYKTFCDRDGCLVQIDDNVSRLTSFDYDHFTTEASIYLVNKFPKWFFESITETADATSGAASQTGVK